MERSARRQLALPASSKFLISRPSVSITILLGGAACSACPACPATTCDRPSMPNPAKTNPIAMVDPRYMVISLLDLPAFLNDGPRGGFCAVGHWVATSAAGEERITL